jgi:hypothetical protein
MPDNFEPLSSAGRVLACSLLSLIETQRFTAADLRFIDEVRITAAMQQDEHAVGGFRGQRSLIALSCDGGLMR